MPVGAILGLAGGLVQAGSARSAGRAQENAANRDLAYQTETRDMIFDRLDPWYQGGNLANQAFMSEMGLADRPMIGGTAPTIQTINTPGQAAQPGQTGVQQNERGQWLDAGGRIVSGQATAPTQGSTRYRVGGQTFNTMDEAQNWANANRTGGRRFGGFQESEDFRFRRDAGNDSINALAGARGGLMSGRTMQDFAKFNQGLASEERGNYLARLSGMSSQGLGAASGQASAAGNAAAGVSNALAGIGNAQAAGQIGVGNAINSGIQNGLGLWQYQQAMRPQNGNASGAGGILTSPFRRQ